MRIVRLNFARLGAITDIFKRYLRVLSAAWQQRHAMAPLQRESDELAFLPAHLELMETPVSPMPKWSMRIIILLFALALIWACFGKLNIVAVAAGQVVSKGRTKIIQPLQAAVVSQIFVYNGELVHKGDLLVKLDSIGVTANAKKAKQSLLNAKLTNLRTTALLQAMRTDSSPQLNNTNGLPANRVAAAQALATSTYVAFTTRQQSLEDTTRQKKAAIKTLQSGIDPLKRYTQMSHTIMQQYEKLLKPGYVSKKKYLQHKMDYLKSKRELTTQRHHLAELTAALAAAKKQLAASAASMKNKLLDQRRQARQKIKQNSMDVKCTQQRQALMELRAPVTGTVQQLAVHTVGGVVTPAQTLMAIVPQKATFEVHAMVTDKDIGFVKPGQPVVVKLASFPYTRYGYLTGTIQSISHDAVASKHQGLVFPAVIKLDSDTLHIDGTPIRITAGMGVSAEIKTGKRRVIDYLLSPLETHVDAAMRER